jgi:hypothetical protein
MTNRTVPDPVAQSMSYRANTLDASEGNSMIEQLDKAFEQSVLDEVIATLHESLDEQQEAFVAAALAAHRAAG